MARREHHVARLCGPHSGQCGHVRSAAVSDSDPDLEGEPLDTELVPFLDWLTVTLDLLRTGSLVLIAITLIARL